MVKNLTIYPQIRRHIAIKWNFELAIVINDIANTVPGIAYPIPAKNVRLFIHLVGSHLFAMLRNNVAMYSQ